MTDASVALGARAEKPSIIARFEEFLREYRQTARTRRELESLTDRELSDLGISRYDIRAIARSAGRNA